MPKRDFDQSTQIRVTMAVEGSVLYVFNGIDLAYWCEFSIGTPAAVVKVAAG